MYGAMNYSSVAPRIFNKLKTFSHQQLSTNILSAVIEFQLNRRGFNQNNPERQRRRQGRKRAEPPKLNRSYFSPNFGYQIKPYTNSNHTPWKMDKFPKYICKLSSNKLRLAGVRIRWTRRVRSKIAIFMRCASTPDTKHVVGPLSESFDTTKGVILSYFIIW